MEEDTSKIWYKTGTVFIEGTSIVLPVWRCIMFNDSYLRACMKLRIVLRRQASTIVAPRVLTKKRKMITRWVIKKPAPASPSPSESNTNQVTHLSKTSSLLHTHVLWLTVILFSGRSWRHLQCRKPSTTRSHRSWSWHRIDWNFQHSDGCAWRTGWHRDPCCHLQSNWIGYTWTDHQFLFRIGNFHEPI